MSRLAASGRLLAAFAVSSLLAVAVGGLVCALSGVPGGVWGRNLGAWVVGAIAAAALARWAGPRTLAAIAVLTPLAIAATLLGEGQLGVRRWLNLGPLSFNAAMLLLPAFAVVIGQRVNWRWIAALLTLAILVWQPDASQASALAVCVVLCSLRTASKRRWVIAAVAVVLAALSWTRPDPLAPVPEVEEVIGLAFNLSPWLAALAVASLAAVTAAPLLATRGSSDETFRFAGLTLTALLLGWCVAPAVGAFPVPFVGVGLSPIIGAWLGVGALAAAARRSRV